MSEDPKQNIDSASTLPMPNEKLDIVSPSLSGEPAYFEYSSFSNNGQTHPQYTYPPPFYLHYPYPPPSYSNVPSSGGKSLEYGYPLPLGTAIKQLPKQYLRVLTRPSVATFAQEKQKAAWNIICVQLAFIAIIGALVNFVSVIFVLPMIFPLLHISKIGVVDAASIYQGTALRNSLSALFSTPASAFADWTILYYVAKAFKGRGEFIEYIYCSALCSIPVQIISTLLLCIPLVGVLLNFVSTFYTFILTIFMTMAVHRLSAGKASLAVLILPICGTVLMAIFLGLLLLVLFPLYYSTLPR